MDDFVNSVEWSPSIGDPGVMGWLTVAAYFACCYKSARVLYFSDRIFSAPVQRQKVLWWTITVLMFFLGVNKQLDLQTLFTATAKYLAHEQGWYEQRRALQKLFIAGVIMLGLAAMVTMFVFYRNILKRHALAIAGMCALLAFILIRASSFHNMDSLISARIAGVKLNWILELGGIALVFWNARILVWQRRSLLDMPTQPVNP